MKQADHIHLRCPGNIGLLGCLVQIFFSNKLKTAKYAGNWDPNSKQPWSYNLQKWIISNSFLTRNCKVLVYGKWENQSKNIIPFFTASYSEKEKKILLEKKTDRKIKLIFVGTFSKGKQPLKSVKVAEELLNRGFNVKLNMYGNGEEFQETKKYIIEKKLSKKIILHGNQTREIIKKAYQESHFLIFISKSEGWPKVLAEAMFWSCLPISTKISCVPEMLGNGERGVLVSENVEEIVEKITLLINSPRVFAEKVRNASDWSQNYTLETFENAISKVL